MEAQVKEGLIDRQTDKAVAMYGTTHTYAWIQDMEANRGLQQKEKKRKNGTNGIGHSPGILVRQAVCHSPLQNSKIHFSNPKANPPGASPKDHTHD